MSNAAPQLPIPDPDLRSLLEAFRSEVFSSLNCHQWGVVKSFNSAKQTVVVQLAVQRQVPTVVNNQTVFVAKNYPLLLDVPIFIPSGGTGFLTFPVTAGDLCLVLFNDRDYDSFWATGNIQAPNSGRMHDLSDGVAIIGFRTSASPLAGYDATEVVLALGTTKLVLGSKVGIQNQTISLLTVLTNLITTLKGFTDTHGDTPNAATLLALTARQTDITNLLQ